MKRLLTSLFICTMCLIFAACGSDGSSSSPGSVIEDAPKAAKLADVGVVMPYDTVGHWAADSAALLEKLEMKGYDVVLAFAGGSAESQAEQIERMANGGVNVLIVAPVDGGALTGALRTAVDAGVSVIAYESLIMNADIAYYAAFDEFRTGVLQAEYVRDALDLASGKGPFSIEIFAGSSADGNAKLIYDGMMSVLRPYIENGQLVTGSGQVNIEDVSVQHFDAAAVADKMNGILEAYYADRDVDAVLCAYDSIASAVTNAVLSAGYGANGRDFPIITGMDSADNAIPTASPSKTIYVYKDRAELIRRTVEMAEAVLEGCEAPVNDTTSYNNGVKLVPSFIVEPKSSAPVTEQ